MQAQLNSRSARGGNRFKQRWQNPPEIAINIIVPTRLDLFSQLTVQLDHKMQQENHGQMS